MQLKLKSGTSIFKQFTINMHLSPKEENCPWQQHVAKSTFCCCQVKCRPRFSGLPSDEHSQTPSPKASLSCRPLGRREGRLSHRREPTLKLSPALAKVPQTLGRIRMSHIMSSDPHNRDGGCLCSAGSPGAELPVPTTTRDSCIVSKPPSTGERELQINLDVGKKITKNKNQQGLETFPFTHSSKALKQ